MGIFVQKVEVSQLNSKRDQGKSPLLEQKLKQMNLVD